MLKGEIICSDCGQYESECKCREDKMEAKDTVMTAKEVQRILDKWNDIDNKEMAYATNARPSILDLIADISVNQAEISFKAGQEQGMKTVSPLDVLNALDAGRKAGIREYHKFMSTPCPHYVASRY